MKKLIILTLFLIVCSPEIYPQFGWVKIYDQQNHKINRAQTFQSQNLAESFLYIQLSSTNAAQNNDAGRVYKLNKNSLQFYSPFQNGFDRFWLFRFPPPEYYLSMQSPFAISVLDTNTALINYVSGCSIDCGDKTYYSTNHGSNWTKIPAMENDFMGVLSKGYGFDPKNAGIVYSIYPRMYNPNQGYQLIYKSTNNGVNWTTIDSIRTYIFSMPQGYVKVNPFRANFIYAKAGTEFIVSSNSGMNFDTAAGSVSFTDIKFNRLDSSIIAFADNKVYKSSNHGISWGQISVMAENIRSLEICYDNPGSVYAGTNNGLYKSNNGGVNWTWYNNSFTPSKIVIGINSDAGMGDTVYAVTQDAVYKVWHTYTGLSNIGNETPHQFSLSQNYPNPFNPTTNIKFDIPKAGFVKLTVFDVLGKEIQTPVNKQLSSGTYGFDFDASNLPSGVYYYKLESNEFTRTKKMVLIK